MKRIILPLLVLSCGLAGCQSANDEIIIAEPETECIGRQCEKLKYSMPNGNDLVLETAHHVIEITAQPDTAYSYYVWTGGKGTESDPDLIVEDGTAMVLVEE